MNERLITVTGRGDIRVEPDVTRLELTLKSVHDTYSEAYAQGTDDISRLAALMEKVGLDKSLPKTTRFDIDKDTRREYDKSHNYIGEKFVGFELDHRVKIDLGMDKALLGKLVRLIGQHLKQAEINISYAVKDTRAAQLTMLDRAVGDAKAKAEVLAKAAGSTLGPVKEINYSVQEVHLYSKPHYFGVASNAFLSESASLDITPDDLEAEESVTVVWYLSDETKP